MDKVLVKYFLAAFKTIANLQVKQLHIFKYNK